MLVRIHPVTDRKDLINADHLLWGLIRKTGSSGCCLIAKTGLLKKISLIVDFALNYFLKLLAYKTITTYTVLVSIP